MSRCTLVPTLTFLCIHARVLHKFSISWPCKAGKIALVELFNLRIEMYLFLFLYATNGRKLTPTILQPQRCHSLAFIRIGTPLTLLAALVHFTGLSSPLYHSLTSPVSHWLPLGRYLCLPLNLEQGGYYWTAVSEQFGSTGATSH